MNKRIFVISLGCSKNHCDLENMLALLIPAGYEIALDEYNADIALINTCGFIGDAKEEAIENILEMIELKKQGIIKKVVVSGCLVQRYKEEFLEAFPEVDGVVGTFDFDKIVETMDKVLEDKKEVKLNSDSLCNFNEMPKLQLTPFYTAYLKIAEGCDNNCSYCAIPNIRGKYVSRTIESLVLEATKLALNGVKELIVIAQDTSRYGIDLYKKKSLGLLLTKLSEIEGIEWIRIHYTYPEMIDDDLLDVMANNPKILHYFDIPIQHINKRILKLMNRASTPDTIKNVIKRIREKMPDATIRTTLLVGFPSETEEEFNELLEFVKTAKFDRLGAFAFSREEDTPAYSMDGQLPKRLKEQRRNKILRAQKKVTKELNQKEIGKIYDVIVEGNHEEYGVYFGRTKKDSVEVDGTVMFEADRNLEFGDIIKVEITGAKDYDLVGKAI